MPARHRRPTLKDTSVLFFSASPSADEDLLISGKRRVCLHRRDVKNQRVVSWFYSTNLFLVTARISWNRVLFCSVSRLDQRLVLGVGAFDAETTSNRFHPRRPRPLCYERPAPLGAKRLSVGRRWIQVLVNICSVHSRRFNERLDADQTENTRGVSAPLGPRCPLTLAL